MPTQLLFPRKVNEDDNDIDVDIDVDIEHATSARPLACLEHNQVNYPALSLSAAIKEIPMADRYVGRENSQDEILVRSDSTDALDKLTAPRACPPPLKRGQDGEYLDAPFRRMSREFTHHSHTFASDLARRSFDVARTSLDVAGTLLRTGTVMAAPSFGSSRAAPVPQEEMIESGKATAADKHQEPDDGDDPLAFTRTFAGGICADIKRRAPWYISDWTDAFKAENRSQSLASIIFLFFACFAPAVTFGMLFDEYTEGQLGIIETILSSGLSGVLYATFSGQPLTILGATGPELAYTVVFFNLCKQLELEFLPARVWQGLWTALFTILLAVFDLSFLMKYISRFTEEIFSGLITVIFILEAVLNILKLYDDTTILGRARAFSGTLLCLGTYVVATMLKHMKAGTLLNPTFRSFLANYGVIISIMLFTFINWVFRDIGNATLQVPSKFEPTFIDPMTNQTRSWIVNPMGTAKPFPAWGIGFCALPALGLTFLGYMDQNLTTLILNRKDHMLKKGPAYHLDLLVCGVFIYPICSFLGLPFTHASTVPCLVHLISLSTREVVPLEGGGSTTRVVKVIEAGRTTNAGIHGLLLLSLLFTPVMRLIPRSVLFGVFLFMGIGSMAGNQLFDRLHLFSIWVAKDYPKYEYTKHVGFWALHRFTILQVSLLIILFVLTRVRALAVVFPFFIGLFVPIRWAMGRYEVWSKEDLKWLDP